MTLLLYASIVLLQLKRVWGMWNLRDLPGGDTSGYFIHAFRSFSEGTVSFAWSPIYTTFFGSLFHISHNAYVIVTLHRLLIVVAACVVVHAVFRQLVSPAVAWLAAAWWAWLPVSFETTYEVHLFSAILPLLALWCALRFPSSYGRAAAFGLIVLLSLLQRNEYAIAAPILAAGFWLGQGRPAWSRAAVPYLLAVAAAVAVTGIGLWRSHVPLSALPAEFRGKHTLNLCQTYAFGYQHRNPAYTASAWLECHELMQATFGQPMPTFFRAVLANPKAIAIHMGWNFLLFPAGLQVLLFGHAGFRGGPDYFPVVVRPSANLLSLAFLSLVAAGVVVLRRGWGAVWRDRLAAHWPGLVVMAGLVVTSVVVALTQRPRSSYLFTLQVILMSLAALCFQALLEHRRFVPAFRRWFPLLAVAILLLTPSYYTPQRFPDRPLYRLYERLSSSRAALPRASVVLMTPELTADLCNYVFATACHERIPYDPAAGPFAVLLDRHGVNVCYLDERMLGLAEVRRWLDTAGASGWKLIAGRDEPGNRWKLYTRSG